MLLQLLRPRRELWRWPGWASWALAGEMDRVRHWVKRVMPAFATEAEEAEWWYKNRNQHGKELVAAMKSGEAQVLTKAKLLERIAASRRVFLWVRVDASQVEFRKTMARGLVHWVSAKCLV
jgi:hypothetical protein